MSKAWDISAVVAKLEEIESKKYISVHADSYRKDDGVIGQILENEFGLTENNLSIRDLGDFELKAIRRKSSTITLCHKRPSDGLSPLELFNKFGYIRPSNRNPAVLKK